VNHRRRVVLGVLGAAGGVGEHRGPQGVIGVLVGPAHALIHHLGNAHGGASPLQVHAHLEKHGGNTGVLADGAMAFSGHPAVGENLRNGVSCRRALFALVGLPECRDVVHRVVVADVLKRVGDALDEIVLLDDCHGGPLRWDAGLVRAAAFALQSGEIVADHNAIAGSDGHR